MAVLESVYNTEAGLGKGADEITIVSKNTLIADSGPMGTMADIEGAPSDEISVYVVRKGDSLSKVAEMFGISENTIRWANDIKKGSGLKEGQELVLLPISGVQYIVKKGDTIKSIAKKFDGDIDEILSFNGLEDGQKLSTGETIIIPDGDLVEEEPKPTTGGKKTIKPKTNYPSFEGYFVRPMDGGRKSQGVHGKNAIDIADSCGVPVYAAASGTVILSRSGSYNGGYGNYIVISHPNGTQTLYSHLSKNLVSYGAVVAKGEPIGLVGHTGRTRPVGPKGCHLHFEIRGAKNPF